MNTVRKLVKKYSGKTVRYKDLPREHQLALALYMSIDGEAWKFPNDKWLDHPIWSKDNRTGEDFEDYDKYIYNTMVRNLKSHYVARYRNFRIGIVEIPTHVIAETIIKSGYPSPNIKDIEAYKKWVLKNVSVPKYSKKNRWPVILDTTTDTTMQDGWHRFACYFTRGDKTIPCLFYLT